MVRQEKSGNLEEERGSFLRKREEEKEKKHSEKMAVSGEVHLNSQKRGEKFHQHDTRSLSAFLSSLKIGTLTTDGEEERLNEFESELIEWRYLLSKRGSTLRWVRVVLVSFVPA